MEKGKHILLKDLEVYKLARELSRIGWKIYNNLIWQDKKIMGDQFIMATDSFGANIVEGYRRYHYLDKYQNNHLKSYKISSILFIKQKIQYPNISVS